MVEISLDRFGVSALSEIRSTLLDIYSVVYAEDLNDPFSTVERFDERLTGHAHRNNWECVLAYAGTKPVGYAYGSALQPGARWWMRHIDPLPEDYTEETGYRTLALFELMVLGEWRGHGIGKRLHDELISKREEERVTLLCDDLDVRSMYESWGYVHVGDQKPFCDSPLFSTMVRQLKNSAD